MNLLNTIYELIKKELTSFWGVTSDAAKKAYGYIAKWLCVLWSKVVECYNIVLGKVTETSLVTRVFVSLSLFLIFFLLWQFVAYYVSQPVFVMVNMLLIVMSSAFTCYIIFSKNKEIAELNEAVGQLEQVRKEKEQEIRSLKSEIHDLNMASRKQQSFGKNSQVLIDTVKKFRNEAKSSDMKGQFILKALAQCSDICCGLIYMKVDDEEAYELAGQFALKDYEIVEEPNARKITADDAILGQVVTSGQMMLMSDVPTEGLTIMSGLGQTDTINVYLLPIKKNGKVIAIAEVASFSKLAIADIWKDIDNVLLED